MSQFLERLTYFTRRREPFAGGHGELRDEDRMWEEGYRQRWQHDKIVRSTHGVNWSGVSALAYLFRPYQIVRTPRTRAKDPVRV